jgi:hypothetical protein
MTQTSIQKARRLREPGLLATESRDEFLGFRQTFHDEIQPGGPIECHYVDWIVMSAWEVRRLLRIKAELINGALLEALKKLLQQALSGDRFEDPYSAADDLARRWFIDDAAKVKVAARLAKLGLDEASIEAEGYRLRAAEIESVDRLLTSKQQGLEKALQFVGKLRKKLGDRLRQSSVEQLESPPILIEIEQLEEDAPPRRVESSAKRLEENVTETVGQLEGDAPPLLTERVEQLEEDAPATPVERGEQLAEDSPPLLAESTEQRKEYEYPILIERVPINGNRATTRRQPG